MQEAGSMRKHMKRKYIGLCFVLPGFAGVLVFYLIPFLDVIRRSFVTAVGDRFCGFQNYQTIFANAAFRLAAGNTARFLAVCLPLLLGISFWVALLLKESTRLAPVLKSAYLVPLAIPSASIVLLWKLVFDGHGMLNGLLQGIRAALYLEEGGFLQGIDWMNTDAAFGVLVFSYIWKNMGYDVVLWLAGLSAVPETIYEAAKVDGAGKWDCFFRITLPCLRPVTFTIVVISLLNSFKVFREAWLVAGNYPQDRIYLLQHLFNNWFRDLSVDKMSAGAVVLSAVVFVIVLILQKSWEEEA